MKQKLTFPLIFAGTFCGFVGILNFLPFWVIAILGGFGLGFGMMVFTAVYGGVVWGVKVPNPPSSKRKNFIGAAGLFLGGYSISNLIMLPLASLASGKPLQIVIYFVLWIICIIIGPRVGKNFLDKSLKKENNGMCLEKFPIFQEIESKIDNANYFVVSFEGIAFFTETNYCCEVFLYQDYALGDLTTPQEVALVGTYFVQKYSPFRWLL